MALTLAQKTAARKSAALIAACLAAAKVGGESGVPTVTVSVVKGSNSTSYTASVDYTESPGVIRTCFVADSTGRVKNFPKISDVLSTVVGFAPAVTSLPESASFSLVIANPEVLAPAALVNTVSAISTRLVSLRAAKHSVQLQSDLRGVELTSKVLMATGTIQQRAAYAELQERKLVLDQLLALYVDQDADMVAQIVALGGVAPV